MLVTNDHVRGDTTESLSKLASNAAIALKDKTHVDINMLFLMILIKILSCIIHKLLCNYSRQSLESPNTSYCMGGEFIFVGNYAIGKTH